MKNFTKPVLLLLFILSGFLVQESFGQSVLNPNDSVVTYNASASAGSLSNPNAAPANQIGKWIRTVRLNWNTNQWKCYEFTGFNSVPVAFRLLYPKSYNPAANDGKVYPMIVFYHGIGEAGPVTDNEYSLANGGPVFTNAVTSGAFDGYILVFQSTGGWGINHDQFTSQVIDYMATNNKLDRFHVLVNGLSEGGKNCWAMMENYPSYVSACLPMSGVQGTDEGYVNTYKYTPIWLFQGGLDGAPDPGTARAVMNVDSSAGGNYKYTLYPTLGHGTWDKAWSESDFFPFCNRAYSSNPWTLFGQTQFCPGSTINVTIGLAPGYDSYQWRKDGVVLSGATGNSINATQLGTYDARIQKNGVWSDWSHTPVVLSTKTPTITPPIAVSGQMSDVIPAADGSAFVNLQVPDSGYTSYTWKKVGSDNVIGTQRILKVSQPGNYIVSVTQQFGCSSVYSPPFTVIDANGANGPSAARSLVVRALSFTQIELDWARNTTPTNPEVAFEVYRGTTSGGPYTYIGQAPADTVRFIDKGLQPNVKYYYVVRAIDSTAAAPLSNEASAITQSDQTPPAPPTNLIVTNSTQTSISLSWNTAVDNVGVTNYFVYVNGVKSYSTKDTTFTVNALTSSQQYAFSVVAVDGSGNVSVNSNQVTAASVFNGLTYNYYTTATNWSVLPNFSTLTPVLSGRMPNVSLANATQTTNFGYVWQGYLQVPVAGTYTFSTSSDDGSAMWFNTTTPTGAPLVNNDGLHGTQAATGTITLQPGTYPIVYEYFQQGGGVAMTVSWACQALFGDNNQHVITDNYFGSPYTPAGTAPAMPTQITANAVSYNKVNIGWTDNSNNESGFEVYRSTSLNGVFAIVATTAANATSFTDSGVQASTTYYYKVQAINKYGSSGFDPASIGGLTYSFYSPFTASNLSTLPTLTPASTGSVTNITLSPATSTTNYAFKFQGTISIPTTGSYTFYTSSDDGSDLYVGGFDSSHLVVKNDFLQGTTERSGTVTLNQGIYPIYVTYFQQGGGVALTASYQGPGITKRNIPDSVFANKQSVATTFALPAVPSAPVNLTAGALSSATINLSWQDTSSTVTGYQLYRSVGDSTHFIQLASFPAATLSTKDTGLFANQAYYYKVLATGIGGNSAYSAVSTATTKDTLPVIVRLSNQSVRYGTTTTVGVSATSVTSGVLSLSAHNLPSFAAFTDNGNRTGVLTLTPAAADAGNYTNLYVVVSDAFGGTDTTKFNLNVNNNYAPVIDTIGSYTLTENDTLSIPLSAHEQNGADTLSFTVNNLPSSYTVTPTGNGRATLLLHPGYAAAGTYTVQVVSNDQNGLSATRSFVLKVLDKDPTVKIYTRFSAGDTITGIWNNVTGVTTNNLFDVNHNNTGIGLSLPSWWWPATYPGGPTTGNNSGLYPDAVLKDYYFFAYFGGPDTVNAVLTGMDTSKSYNLTFYAGSVWSGAADNGATKYRVGSQSVTLRVQNNTQNTVTLSGLKPAADGTITFTMSRADAATTVGYLNSFVITQIYDDGTVPAAPQSLQVQNVSGAGVQLSWTNTAYNATGYRVYRSLSAGGVYSTLGTLGAAATGYTDSTVSGAQEYYYKVQAYNGYGVSAFAGVDSILTADRIPKVSPIGDVTTSNGQTVTVNVSATDDVTDHVTLTASGLPSFAGFVDNGNGTGVVTIQPGSGTNGIYNGVTITATDLSDSSRSASFNIYVVEQNVSSTYVNFTDTVLASKPWNNMAGIPFAGTVLSNLPDDSNTPTGVSVTLLDGFQGDVEVGMNPNNGTNVYPASVLRSGFFTTGTAASRLQIKGLSQTKKYNFVLFNSYSAGSNCLTNFTLNGQTLSVDGAYNVNRTVQFNGIVPDGSGTVTISVAKAGGADYAMLSSLIIQAYDPSVVPLMSPADLRMVNNTTKAITLQWQDRAGNETGYEVWRSADGSGAFTLLTTLPANTTSYTDGSLNPDVTYYYSVRAKLNSTYSAYTNVAKGYTYASQVYIAFDDGTLSPAPPAPWNNLNKVPQLNNVWSGFLNDAGVATNMGMVQTARWEGEYGGGVNTGNNSGIYPDNAMIQSYGMFAGESSNMTLTGLDLSKTYDFTFFASATGVFDATAYYTVNGSQPVYLNANLNKGGTITLYGVRPNADGTALVTITAYGNAQFALIGTMIVKGATASVNAAPAGPVTAAVRTTGVTAATSNQLAVNSTDSSEEALKALMAYPNPFDQSFTLAVPAVNNERVLVRITDVGGRVVYQKQFEGLYQGTNALRIEANVPTGIYFVTVIYVNRNEQKTIKVIRR